MRIVVGCVLSLAGSGCWGLLSEDTAHMRIEGWRAPAPHPCDQATRPPVPGATPTVEGTIEVESVRGERRLWLEDRDVYAVSNDGKRIAVGGHGGVSIWSADDGRLQALIPVKGPINVGKLRWSSDDHALHLEDAEVFGRIIAVVGVHGDDLGTLRFLWSSSATRPRFGALTVARR